MSLCGGQAENHVKGHGNSSWKESSSKLLPCARKVSGSQIPVSPETFCPTVNAAEEVLNSVKAEELGKVLEEIWCRLLLLIQGV